MSNRAAIITFLVLAVLCSGCSVISRLLIPGKGPGGMISSREGPETSSSSYGLAVDHDGNIYAVSSERHSLGKFDPRGNLVFNRKLTLPHTDLVTLDHKGNVFVADRFDLSEVQRLNPSGALQDQWDIEDASNPQNVRSIAAGRDGCVFVLTGSGFRPRVGGEASVEKLDSFGQRISTVVCLNAKGDEYRQPRAIAVDSNDNLYVAEVFGTAPPQERSVTRDGTPVTSFRLDPWALGARVLKLDRSGKTTASYPLIPAHDPTGKRSDPQGIAVGPNGNIYILDVERKDLGMLGGFKWCIKELDPSGRLVLKVVAPKETMWSTSGGPIAVDDHGNIYVISVSCGVGYDGIPEV